MAFILARSMQLPVWDEDIRRAAKAYWQTRRVLIIDESDRVLRGRRSNVLCNLIALDPTKVAATLLITWMEPGTCDCVLTVDTTFQVLTDWNKAWLQLEMATFESYLLYNDLNGELWEQFLRLHDVATWTWQFSGGILGNTMSHADRNTFLKPPVQRVVCRAA